MKYLFVILVCYAVKCEKVGSNYFVVKMPQDNIQQKDIKDFKKSFQVYWNVPTMQCASKKIPFHNLYEKFGIIQNDNDRFIGNKIVVLYNETDFPSIIKNKTSGKKFLRNGGVPQEGNLENHLIAFENNLNTKIPDPYYDGIAIIDFESWRPVFRQNFGSLLPHRILSIEIEKRLHNWWPKMWIEREATLRFEAAARRFMQTTLSMAKEIRPNALWGYYGLPYCFNVRGRDMTEKCAANIDKENDSIYWLWAESTALFPSIYSSVTLSSSQLSSLIKGRVKETSRVRGGDTPIFPYFWFRYRDAGFISEKDLEVALATLYQSKASGFIIWGSSNDVNTVDKCNKLFKYVDTVLGPKIAKYTKPVKEIYKDHLQNKSLYKVETSTDYDEFYYSRSTQSLNTDKMYSTETVTDISKFTETDESTHISSNDEMSSTESTITNNDYTTTNDVQTLHNFDFTLSLLKSSTFLSEYTNTKQNKQALNNEKITSTETAYDKHTNFDDNPKLLRNEETFSTETSNAYSKYTNTGQSMQTVPNEISLANKETTTYTTGKKLPTSTIDSSEKQTTNVYNEYFNDEKKMKTLINANLLLLPESSTTDYKDSDHNTTFKNDDISLSKISTIDNSYKDKSSQTTNNYIFNEGTTFVYNKYFETEEDVPTLNNDDVISATESSTIYDENRDYITTTFNNDEMSLSKVSTMSDSYRDKSSQTSNDLMFNQMTTVVYNNYSKTEENVTTLDNDDVTSTSDSSTIYDENKDFIVKALNNDGMSLLKMTTIDNSYRDETSNKHMSNEVTTIVYNKYSETGNNLQILNNDQDLSSTESSSIYNEISDHSASYFNNDELSSTDSGTLYSKYINTDQNQRASNDKKILSKGTSTIFDHFFNEDQSTESFNNIKNLKETSLPLDEISYTVKNTDILIDGEIITKKNDWESTKDDFFINNMLPKSTEDRSDYLITLDNSTNTETFKPSEYQNRTNIEDDYLIIARNPKNKQKLQESITESKLETVYFEPQADINHETVFNEHFSKTANDLDLVVKYIDKKNSIKRNEELTTKADSFYSIKLSNSDDGDGDRSDYLIIVDNSTNTEIYNQSDNTNITNADNDYLIVVPDYDNKKSDSNLDSTTETKTDFEKDTKSDDYDYDDDNIDPVDSISSGDESFNNNKLLNSDDDNFDYLIKLVNFTNKETKKQYEYTESTTADNDYIIIIKNVDD